MAGNRIVLIHIKDLNLDLGRKMVRHEIGFDAAIEKRVFVPLGDGDLDLVGMLPLLPRWAATHASQGRVGGLMSACLKRDSLPVLSFAVAAE